MFVIKQSLFNILLNGQNYFNFLKKVINKATNLITEKLDWSKISLSTPPKKKKKAMALLQLHIEINNWLLFAVLWVHLFP